MRVAGAAVLLYIYIGIMAGLRYNKAEKAIILDKSARHACKCIRGHVYIARKGEREKGRDIEAISASIRKEVWDKRRHLREPTIKKAHETA